MLHHVAIPIHASQLERAELFWRILGFRPVQPPGSLAERAVWLEAGEPGARTQIHLLVEPEPGTRLRPGRSQGPPHGKEGRQSAAGHTAIVVADYDRAREDLRAEGFEFEDRRPHWGAKRAFARHPGGYTVELMAAPPG